MIIILIFINFIVFFSTRSLEVPLERVHVQALEHAAALLAERLFDLKGGCFFLLLLGHWVVVGGWLVQLGPGQARPPSWLVVVLVMLLYFLMNPALSLPHFCEVAFLADLVGRERCVPHALLSLLKTAHFPQQIRHRRVPRDPVSY